MNYFNHSNINVESHRDFTLERQIFLIDLDGTLLENHSPFFQCANVFMMFKRFVPVFGWKECVPKTKACLELILENTQPNRATNYEVVKDAFLGFSLLSEADTLEILWEFYLEDFPKLAFLTSPVKGAKQGLQALRDANKTLYLATNPIWPKQCVLKRLEWAGIPSEWFTEITHSENWNVCKPNPRYYDKILTDWKLDPKNTVMIGNDFKKDGPSTQVGIPCLLLPSKNKHIFWKNLANSFDS